MSNIQGTAAVGQHGRLHRRQARAEASTGASGSARATRPDDFRMMAEVLRRRFSRVAKLRTETGALSLAAVGADEAPEGDGDDDEPLDLDPDAGPIEGGDRAGAARRAGRVPDLVIVDGGKGQLSAAVGVMDGARHHRRAARRDSRSGSRSSTCPAAPLRSSCRDARRRSTSSSASATRRIGSRSRTTATCAASARCAASSTRSPASVPGARRRS